MCDHLLQQTNRFLAIQAVPGNRTFLTDPCSFFVFATRCAFVLANLMHKSHTDLKIVQTYYYLYDLRSFSSIHRDARPRGVSVAAQLSGFALPAWYLFRTGPLLATAPGRQYAGAWRFRPGLQVPPRRLATIPLNGLYVAPLTRVLPLSFKQSTEVHLITCFMFCRLLNTGHRGLCRPRML
jgi:hypothetical protein